MYLLYINYGNFVKDVFYILFIICTGIIVFMKGRDTIVTTKNNRYH